MKNADVVIIGGGVMGSATAFYLTSYEPTMHVVVVEKDPTYEKASTTLSMSNARIQFSLEDNIRISQYAFEILQNFETEMAVEDRVPRITLRREGNLFIVDEKGKEASHAAMDLQKKLGCDVEWMGTDDIRKAYSLYDPDSYEGATFSRGDGHFDAYAFLMGYRAKARHQKTDFLHDEVASVETDNGKVNGVVLKSGDRINSGIVVNCAGAWAAGVAETAGVKLPIVPVKRQVFALDVKVKPETPLPLTVLPSGLYFRTETGGGILLGKSMEEDPVGFDFTWDDDRFMEILWPELAEFVPAFDTLKLVRGWAGLYAVNTLDGNAVLGEWPELSGFFLANGFSGHGLQQAPAVGRYISEKILGRSLSLDLSIFSPERILENRPICEKGLV